MSELIDNRAYRVRALKEIIARLHRGEAPERVKGALREIVRQTDYGEIVAMEEQLMAEGMPASEVQSMCDLHSQVTREVLVAAPPRHVAPGHPVDTMRQENLALRGALLRMQVAMKAIEGLEEEALPGECLLAWRQAVNELMDVEKHYQRKENAFFPCLERHGITAPSKVMWAKDDEVRGLLKELAAALEQEGVKAGEWKLVAATVGEAARSAVEEMIYKEEHILLPLCLDTFTEEEWGEIWAVSPRYGWCLVEPRTGYQPPEVEKPPTMHIDDGRAIQLPSGHLSLEQLRALLSALPVDLTFVDADDRVAFFSEGQERIFARSRAILGRKVQHCHPPKSVSTVERILSDFRAGRQSVAEFWIEFHGRFVHIRYFAVRDEQQRYVGTLEVTQDITRLRELEGERRLLEYAEAGQ